MPIPHLHGSWDVSPSIILLSEIVWDLHPVSLTWCLRLTLYRLIYQDIVHCTVELLMASLGNDTTSMDL